MTRLRRHLPELAILTLVLVPAAWLRVGDLDRFIASDELRWTCRSINFHGAMAERDWGDTFQVGHPGVVTMWLGSAALPLDLAGRWRQLCRTTDGGRDLSRLDDVGMEGVLQTIAPLLFRARWGVAVGTLSALALLYLLLRHVLGIGPVPTAAALAMLALDPFLVAHSRVLHLDAMLSLLALAAVVGLSDGDRIGRASVLLSGAMAGMAALNKSSALVLLPFALALFAWRARRRRDWGELRQLVPWCAAAAVTFAVLWPAMWVDPAGTVFGVLTKATSEGAVPHGSGNFFMGRPVDDPGLLFYPVAAAYRLTPWAALGLALALGVAVIEPVRHDRAATGLIRLLLAWSLVFALFMTVGPKKFDRYLLPSLAALNLAAGLALGVAIPKAMGRWRGSIGSIPLPTLVLLGGFVAGQAVEILRVHPYAMAYYSPLLGGARTAQRAVLVGWGEGYDLAADWLNAKEDAAELEVSVRGVSNFAPLFRGRTRSAPGYRPGATDYVVLYVNQVQRRRNEDLVAAYHESPGAPPVHVVRLAGIEYAWVYANGTVELLRTAIDGVAARDDVLVAAGETVFARHYRGRQPLVRYWGHWSETEMTEALGEAFPLGWRRAWVVRYPGHDPDVALRVLATVAVAGPTSAVAGGAAELTPFTRSAP